MSEDIDSRKQEIGNRKHAPSGPGWQSGSISVGMTGVEAEMGIDGEVRKPRLQATGMKQE